MVSVVSVAGRYVLLSVGAALTVSIGVLIMQMRHTATGKNRDACTRNLMALHSPLRMYMMDHAGQLPSLSTDMWKYASNPRILVCPGSRTKFVAGRTSDLTNWMDYLYVYWPMGESTSESYPIMYDKDLSHHGGEGLNVMTVDGTCFWDEGGAWLREFAATHPDLRIPLPEGVPSQ